MITKCEQCSYTAPFKCHIKTHVRWVHSEAKQYHCPFLGCNYKTNIPGNLKRHQRMLHERIHEVRRPFPCKFDNCEYRASHKYLLQLHVSHKHTPNRTRNFECPMCPAKFYKATTMKAHITSHTREKSFKCSACRFQTHQQSLLTAHIKFVHDKVKKFYCSIKNCAYNATVRADRTEHLATCHDPKDLRPLECNFSECAYRVACKSALNRHIDACHSPNRKKDASCPLCSKTFYTKYDLKNHITNIHTKQTSYSCGKCGFATPYSSYLTIHYQRDHGEGPRRMFKCDSCDYETYQKYSLNSHRVTAHGVQRKFQCDHSGCDFKTNDGRYFRTHSLMHQSRLEDQFPLPCDFPGCDFRRRHKSEIEKHKMLHQSSKLGFKCKQCPKRCYPDRFSLHFHQCLVHNKRSFRCSLCDFAASHHSTLTKHMSRCHSPNENTCQDAKLSPKTGRTMNRGKDKDKLGRATKSKSTFPQFSPICNYYPSIPIVLLQRIRLKTVQ